MNDIGSKPTEWLEIDFGNLTYLTQVETQGRFNNGRGKEYADYYVLMYTRMDTIKNNQTVWIEYKPNNSSWDTSKSEYLHWRNSFIGYERIRKDLYIISIFNHLDPPIVAKRLRFYPVSKQTRTICMRVEVYV